MVWDLFSNFTIEKQRAVLIWSPLKYTQDRWQQAKNTFHENKI